jgi:hypothetical protein
MLLEEKKCAWLAVVNEDEAQKFGYGFLHVGLVQILPAIFLLVRHFSLLAQFLTSKKIAGKIYLGYKVIILLF